MFVIAWGVVVTYVSGAAVIAFGGPDVPVVGAVSGAGGSALVAAGMVWATRAATRLRQTGDTIESVERSEVAIARVR